MSALGFDRLDDAATPRGERAVAPAAAIPGVASALDFAILHGEVGHRRSRPARNAFAYPAFCLRLPIGRLAELASRGIRLNATGWLAFHERDHGSRDGAPLEAWFRALLRNEGLEADGEIVLYTFPRMLGYVFNPVSFWLAHDRGGVVRAVLAEVNNTFGESHNYLLARADGGAIRSGESLEARKVFHVSPFCAVDGRYRFRFAFGPDRWLARIDYFDGSAASEPLLETWISGTAEALTTRATSRLAWRYRWFTLAAIARIHWQALRLWSKRVPFFRKPAPPAAFTTR